jgi:hypothetical protein
MAESVSQYLARIGKRGGAKTVSQLTPAQRKKKAQLAARARWSKVKKEKP